MPFTPFHMGPGLAFKALGGRRFSLMTFGFAQVAMDVEPLVRILRGDSVLHGFTHTYVGATLIGAASAIAGKPLCQMLLNRWPADPEAPFLDWLRGGARMTWSAAIAGAFVGTYSHVVLDSLMHSDMHPWAPVSATNAMLGLVSLDALHVGCVLSGAFGAIVLAFGYWFRPRTARRSPGNEA